MAILLAAHRIRAESADKVPFSAEDSGVAAINAFGHLRQPATPYERMVTTPNVDTPLFAGLCGLA